MLCLASFITVDCCAGGSEVKCSSSLRLALFLRVS